MENWTMTMKKADFNALAEELHITPVTARLLRNRDLTKGDEMQEFLFGNLEGLHDPHTMEDMDRAVGILAEKIRAGQKIRIIGDYDIDGVNSTYILLEGLNRLGAQVDYDIPDRMLDGYGVNGSLIDNAFQSGADTILTCDNGISASEALSYAKEKGMTVVVTDHHRVPFEDNEGIRREILPPADAVVDPHRADCPYPFKELCGAGVAYKLMQCLFDAFGRDRTELEDLIENVAIATVGDVMDLVGENRRFVRHGLKMLEQTHSPGLRALITLCGLEDTALSAYHIGFVLGPCINATGRLDSAKRALSLLTCRKEKEALEIAADLKALNDSRKNMTEQGLQQAIELVETTPLGEDRVLVVYLPDCHESLAGIIAGRLRERYYRPTIVLTKGEGLIKGSGRSTENYSMFEELSTCKDLLLKFGGHPLAAGLSLEEHNIEPLRRKLNENCRLTETDLQPKVKLDMMLPFYYASERQVNEIAMLEPFGKGNSRPLFALKDVYISDCRILGKSGKACKMRLTDSYGTTVEGIYFGEAETFLKDVHNKPQRDIAYYPNINEFRGRRTLQMTVTNYR